MPDFFDSARSLGFSIPDLSSEKKYFPNTNCLVLNGKLLAQKIVHQCQEIFSGKNPRPHLSVILVGDNPASKVYVKNKIRIFEQAGFLSTLFEFPEDASSDTIVQCIEKSNHNSHVHGILVQLPLPKHLNSEDILKTIDFQKDVDGFAVQNIGLLALNNRRGIPACTPFGIMLLLAAYGIDPAGKHCVVIGRSPVVGKPMGLLLLNANATVTFVHSQTKDIRTYTSQADLLIAASGKKHLIRQNDIKNGVLVVDVGIHQNEDGTLSGDVHPDVKNKAGALTPVPGGVGPMTIASLLMNTALCYSRVHFF